MNKWIMIFVFALLLIPISIISAEAGWKTEFIDGSISTTDADVGLYSSIKLTKGGKLDISYYDYTNSALKYATNRKDDSWNTFTVDKYGVTGMYTSLDNCPPKGNTKNNYTELRNTRVRHISYFDHKNKNLMYATATLNKDSNYGNFVTSTVDSGAFVNDGEKASVGWFCSISTAVDHRPHIAYYDLTNRNLMYAHKDDNNEGFKTKTVDGDVKTDVGSYCSIVNIDPVGGCYISYHDVTNNMLKCATNIKSDKGHWTSENVAPNGDDHTITADRNGKLHIAYYDYVEGNLKYATNKSYSWVTSLVDNTRKGMDSRPVCGRYNSIAVDDSGYVHISYYDDSTDYVDKDLKYATNKSGSWVVTTVDSEGIVGMYTSLAVSHTGKEVYISYYDHTNKALKLATYKK